MKEGSVERGTMGRSGDKLLHANSCVSCRMSDGLLHGLNGMTCWNDLVLIASELEASVKWRERFSIVKKKGKGSPYSITERRVPELIPVLCSQPADDVSHKPGGRLPLLSARPAVTPPPTLKRAAANFAAGEINNN